MQVPEMRGTQEQERGTLLAERKMWCPSPDRPVLCCAVLCCPVLLTSTHKGDERGVCAHQKAKTTQRRLLTDAKKNGGRIGWSHEASKSLEKDEEEEETHNDVSPERLGNMRDVKEEKAKLLHKGNTHTHPRHSPNL